VWPVWNGTPEIGKNDACSCAHPLCLLILILHWSILFIKKKKKWNVNMFIDMIHNFTV
jgi:hypothetical protein